MTLMVVDRRANEKRWQKREYIGLQESDKKFQNAKKGRTEDTNYGNSCPCACRSWGGRRNKTHNTEKYEMTSNHVR